MTYISRDQIGLRKPNGVHLLVPSQVINTAFHYPGTPSPINAVGAAGLRRVCSALRGWQAYHMDTRGWSDIAYCVAIDQVGRKYDLRGIRVRSAANGGTQVNLNYGAILLVLGNNEEPSAAMAKAAGEVVQDYRVKFTRIPKRPTWHGAVRPGGTASDPSTDCPGKRAIAQIKAGKFDARPTTVTPKPPVPPPVKPPVGDDMSDADVTKINAYSQTMAVANNTFTRQVVSAATKAILDAVAGVDEATAAAVQNQLNDDFQRLSDEIIAEAHAASEPAPAPEGSTP
jgi:hypothetical protein